MIREVTRGNWKTEDYILYAMEIILLDLEDNYKAGTLKEYMKEFDSIHKIYDWNGKLKSVSLYFFTETFTIAIYTDMRTINGIGKLFTVADGIEEIAHFKSYIAESINDLYR